VQLHLSLPRRFGLVVSGNFGADVLGIFFFDPLPGGGDENALTKLNSLFSSVCYFLKKIQNPKENS
jgi:hypothetical protein